MSTPMVKTSSLAHSASSRAASLVLVLVEAIPLYRPVGRPIEIRLPLLGRDDVQVGSLLWSMRYGRGTGNRRRFVPTADLERVCVQTGPVDHRPDEGVVVGHRPAVALGSPRVHAG